MARSPYSRFGQTTITGASQTQRTHVVTGSETLMSIAAYEYQTGYDSQLWRAIADENDVLDIEDVSAGDSLVVPPLPESET